VKAYSHGNFHTTKIIRIVLISRISNEILLLHHIIDIKQKRRFKTLIKQYIRLPPLLKSHIKALLRPLSHLQKPMRVLYIQAGF